MGGHLTRLHVVRPGLLSTVQDLGRIGYQSVGVPVAGPMDWYAHRLANRLVGNDAGAAALEITLLGPELLAEGDMMCAVAGAEFEIAAGTATVPANQPFGVRDGERILFRRRVRGTRAALAVRGGIDVPETLGSRATHLVSRMGPFGGRAIQAGDVLPVGSAAGPMRFVQPQPRTLPDGAATLRVLPGPHRERFTAGAWTTLCTESFVVTNDSNRMGYRLDGAPIEHVRGADILSEATPVGALQVPASGHPILLMADRQTTGGYTIVATVITADLPLAGQLGPGDRLRFVECSRDEAIDALRARERALG